MLLRFCTSTLPLALIGCGPVVYSMNAFPAESSVAHAAEANAADCAPYRYHAAVAYLSKAKEEAGQGQYQDATQFAAHADALAHDAVEQCRPSTAPASTRSPRTGSRVGLAQ